MTIIVMGADAIDRSTFGGAGYTFLNEENPANASGTIDTVEIYANSEMSGIKVGTFYGSGTSWTLRDYTTVGTAASGEKTTYTGLNIQVEEGDLIGIYYTGGLIEKDTSGALGLLTYSGDAFDGGTYTYTEDSDGAVSLYASGSTTPPAFMKPIKIW